MSRHSRETQRWALVTLLAVLLACVGAAAVAADFTVDSTADYGDAVPGDGVCADRGGSCTLRAAVEEGNALAGDDTIAVPEGVYDIGGPLIVFSTMSLSGAGEDSTILDGGGNERVVTVDGGSLSADNLTIRNGDVGSSSGGNVYVASGASMSLTSCTVTGGAGTFGGGILALAAGSLSLVQTTVSKNLASGHGGGIFARDTPVLLSLSRVEDNSAGQAGGGLGVEGVEGVSTATIEFSTISGNSAGHVGGGLWILEAELTLTDSTVSANSASDSGGGLRIDASSSIDSVIERCAFIANRSGAAGGALLTNVNNDGRLDISNTTISGNAAELDGGGVFMETAGRLSLSSCTVTDNTATAGGVLSPGDGNGGGIFALNSGVAGGLLLRNTVVAGNHDLWNGLASQSAPDCAVRDAAVVSITSEGHNFIGFANDLCALSGDQTGDQVGWNAAIVPGLGGLTDVGSSTWYHPLLEDSPLIDGGDPLGCVDQTGGLLSTDQRGAPRPYKDTPCDIGAVEPSPSELPLFIDGFEDGDTTFWSTVTP